MAHRSRGRDATRLAGVLAVAGLAWLSAAGPAAAATPDPLGETLQRLVGGSAAPAPPTLPSPPAPSAPPSLPDLPTFPALPDQPPGDGAPDHAGARAEAQAPAGDDLGAVDAAVAEFLGGGSQPGSRPDAASALPSALAFTGTDPAPAAVLAGGLIALGIAFLHKAHQLAVVQ